MITLELPYPPSINHYYSYYRGRPVLSRDARTYRHQVRAVARALKIEPILEPLAVRIDIHPPDKRRRDADNLQKPVLDALQHAGVFWDDSQVVWLLTVKHESQSQGCVQVTLDEFNTTSSTLADDSKPIMNATETSEGLKVLKLMGTTFKAESEGQVNQ